MFTLDDIKNGMREIKPPVSADAARQVRNRFLDARELVQKLEEDIRLAAGRRGVDIESLYRKLEAAKDGLLEAQRDFELVGPFSSGLEAAERADQLEAAHQAAQKKAQATHALEEEARTKAAFQERWLAAGGTLEQFQKAWGGPDGLWAQELRRRVTEGGHAPVDLLRATGRYVV